MDETFSALLRPQPPQELILAGRELFLPAPELESWLRETFIEDGGALCNPDHAHLETAEIAVLWTTAPCVKGGRRLIGTAEMPNCGGSSWVKARERFQLLSWFGRLPDFLLTFDALYWTEEAEDLEACALSEHELYHCGQRQDEFGQPKFTRDGEPVFALRAHDVEEHLGVARRYGAVGANVAELVRVIQRGPEIARTQIAQACGTCLR